MLVNGDRRLSLLQRVRYVANAFRELWQHLTSRGWQGSAPVIIDDDLAALRTSLATGPSPLRLYTEYVSAHFARLTFPDRPTILDVGCGSGGAIESFDGFIEMGQYVGVDIASRPQWHAGDTAEEPDRSFVAIDARQLDSLRTTFDVVYSSNTLEHLPRLGSVLKSLNEKTSGRGLGFHIVPGVWSIFAYGFHGYRRASPRFWEAAFRRAGADDVKIYALGGFASFLLHTLAIALPATLRLPDTRKRFPNWYAILLQRAIACDAILTVFPLGYLFVVRPSSTKHGPV